MRYIFAYDIFIVYIKYGGIFDQSIKLQFY